jgi:hypothetical protein
MNLIPSIKKKQIETAAQLRFYQFKICVQSQLLSVRSHNSTNPLPHPICCFCYITFFFLSLSPSINGRVIRAAYVKFRQKILISQLISSGLQNTQVSMFFFLFPAQLHKGSHRPGLNESFEMYTITSLHFFNNTYID